MAHDTWWKFKAYNTESVYGWGTTDEADKYCDFLNSDREINVFHSEEIEDDDEIIAKLESGNGGVNLADELQEIPTTQDLVDACKTLDQLLDVLQAMTDSRDVDMTSLPTFGGTEPKATDGIWSWDATRMIIGTGSDYEIVDRD